MRIALFTDSYLPELNGVAASVSTLHEQLRLLGHDAHVFAPSNKDTEGDDDSIHRLYSMPLIFLKERRAAFFSPTLMRQISSLGFDIIHTHSEFMMGLLGKMAARRQRFCPMVHTYHTIWEDYTYYITHGLGDSQARKFARKFSRSWCNGCDLIVAPTQKTERLLRDYGVTKPIRILPTGLDIDRFAPALHNAGERAKRRQECGIPADAKVLLNIGRISREKNLEAVLEAMPEVFARHPDAWLVLIGSGPWVEALQRKAQDLGIAHRTRFPGPKPWAAIDEYYAIGDVFVSASQSETQGLTYIEALASGLPVIALYDDALEGVILPGVNGQLLRDTRDMPSAIDEALSPEGEVFRTNAAPSVSHYGKAAFAREMVKTYQLIRYRQTGDPSDKPIEMPEFLEV